MSKVADWISKQRENKKVLFVRSKQCRYFKMKVLTTHKSENVNEMIEKSFDEKSIFFPTKARVISISPSM